MKTGVILAVIVWVAATCDTSAGQAEDLKMQKFLMVDEMAFKGALSSLKKEKIEPIGAYGIFIDNAYAGQIGDTIRIDKQIPSDVKIVARMDGNAWTNTTVWKPINTKLFGLYGLKINPQPSQNIFCSEMTESSCRDFHVKTVDTTDVVYFKADAFYDKQFVVVRWDDFGGPRPKKDNMKTINFATEPAGADIYLDDEKFWKTTNSLMNIWFEKPETLTKHVPLRYVLRKIASHLEMSR
jgi:hypothetical protein